MFYIKCNYFNLTILQSYNHLLHTSTNLYSMDLSDYMTHVECSSCLNNFVNFTFAEFVRFVKQHKQTLPPDFYSKYNNKCYGSRFECLACEQLICRGCLIHKKHSPHIICPICNTQYFADCADPTTSIINTRQRDKLLIDITRFTFPTK